MIYNNEFETLPREAREASSCAACARRGTGLRDGAFFRKNFDEAGVNPEISRPSKISGVCPSPRSRTFATIPLRRFAVYDG